MKSKLMAASANPRRSSQMTSVVLKAGGCSSWKKKKINNATKLIDSAKKTTFGAFLMKIDQSGSTRV